MRYLLTVINVFSKFAQAVPIHSINAKTITPTFRQVLTTANPRHPKRLQTDKGKKFFNSNLQTLMKCHGIQHFAIKSKQKRQWLSYLIGPSRPKYLHICQTAAPCAEQISCKTWLTPTTTRATAPLAWSWLMSKRKTKTVFGCPVLGTETPTINIKFRGKQWCEPEATKQFFTKATCQNRPTSTLE